MEETLVFIDDGFLAKLSKHFGSGKYVKFDRIKFSEKLSEKEGMKCVHIFYYTAPPYQNPKSSKEESVRYRNYEKFVKKISKNELITVREGRCQRLKISGKFVYKQKAVDSLIVIDLMSVPIDYPNVKKIILIASDSDFVPVIENLRKRNIKIILYTYYEKGRKATFSTSNELIKSVYKYVLLDKEDFDSCPISNSKES